MWKRQALLGLWVCSNAAITTAGVKVEIPLWVISALWAAFFTTTVFLYFPELKRASIWLSRRLGFADDVVVSEDAKKIVILTQEEYDALETKAPKTIYMIKKEN